MSLLANFLPPGQSRARPSSSQADYFRERPAANGVNDWLFVTPKESKGWILDAICREIGARLDTSWDVAYNPKTLPKARVYFFAHYWNYLDHLRRNPHIRDAKTLVWYTHPREIPYSEAEQLDGYGKATQIIFTCSEFLNIWRNKGLPQNKATVVLGGADPLLFKGHKRGNGVVGLSSSFYERKNPDRLLDLVKLLPHRHFRLIGRKWDQYSRINELLAQPNFDYLACDYEHYPILYSTFDIFVSLSVLEGGPIPLLEAMMENAVPVASRTGFAPDLIAHGRNGFLFDVEAPARETAELIEQAARLKVDVRKSVSAYSWDNFARKIHSLAW